MDHSGVTGSAVLSRTEEDNLLLALPRGSLHILADLFIIKNEKIKVPRFMMSEGLICSWPDPLSLDSSDTGHHGNRNM